MPTFQMPRSICCLAALLPALLLAGCGSRFPTAPVSGVVRLEGEPLAEARIAFEPLAPADSLEAGPGSYATTDSQGRYTLETLDGRPGAVIGRHRVSISTAITPPRGPGGEDLPATREKVPQRYRGAGTELEWEVTEEGTDSANFELEGGRD